MSVHTIQDSAGIAHSLAQTLERLPGVKLVIAGPATSGSTPQDEVLGLKIGAKSFDLKVVTRQAVYPRDVRDMIWRVQHEVQTDHPVVHVLAARTISDGAKTMLRENLIGYFDSGGSMFIPAKFAYIYIERPAPKPLVKAVNEVFGGRRAMVLQAMLKDRETAFNVKEIAERTQLAPSTVSSTLKALENFDWVSVDGRGPSKTRKISDASGLLDAWAKKLTDLPSQALRRFYIPGVSNTASLATKICNLAHVSGHKVELTGELAAQHYAPYLTRVNTVACRMLIGRLENQLLRQLDAKEVVSGANLEVIETKDESDFCFTREVDDILLATPLQVYLDLLRDGTGRSKEQAAHLRQEKLGF